MRRRAVRLTRTLVERVRPAASDLFVWDAAVAGFGLKVTPKGARTYVLQYRWEGQARRIAIGRHGAPWTVETARAKARALLAEAAAGRDPIAERARARSAMTVAEMGELFLREGLEGRGEHWAGAVRQAFRNHIGPVLGERLAHEVESADIDALFRTVAQGGTASGGASQVRGGPEAANAAQASISAAFSFAVRCAIVPDSPARGVRRFVGRRVERFLTPEEYRRLGRVMAIADAFSSVNPSALALVRLVLLTGVSPGHALQLDRAHFQPNLRRLRFVAGGRERIVWLGWRALSLVNRLAAEAGEGPLFPGRGGRGRLSDVQPVWERLRVAAGIADVRLIDLRHSFAARAIATGENPRVVGRLLTHAAAGTMERYPTVPDAPVKAAAERISGEIAELLGAPLGGAAAWRREAPEADPQVTALLAAAPQARCLDLAAAARRAGLTPRTLVVYRDDGIGPPYRRVGGRVVYPEAELDLWIERRGGRRAARTRRRP